ncbi:avidin-like isoform X1 [Crotalus tigris]|uniref:avidin-like isoform X1 n=1 Tax=Crotalus tigris TaxID=88082 RepID=UPI00192F491B|nr:avidin-like isoform X1 [Crotalus tigris]
MAIGLTALGLLAFLLGCSGTFVEPQNSERTAKCSLTGRWVNDRGAKIVISHNINGVFSGVYVAAPSATNKTIPPLMLQGIQHLDPQPTFGFILKSNISASSTVFVGQCFIDENGEEHLKTAWLLRRNLPSPAETWKATRGLLLGHLDGASSREAPKDRGEFAQPALGQCPSPHQTWPAMRGWGPSRPCPPLRTSSVHFLCPPFHSHCWHGHLQEGEDRQPSIVSAFGGKWGG